LKPKGKVPTIVLFILLLTLSMFTQIVKISTADPTTRRVPQDYPTIQAAINNATTGDIILVAPGTYPEYVCVNKSVTLMGTNRESTITGASTSATVVDVKASNVQISNFKISCPTLQTHGIWVEPPLAQYYTNVNITDNTIIACNTGIFYSRSSKCYITNNTLERFTYGIRLYDSNYNVVDENFINTSNYYGINFYARCHDNNMTKNTIVNTKYAVLLEYTNFTRMYLNKIENNTAYAIRLSYSFNSTIVGNDVVNNAYGVYIWNCSQNQFYYNNFINNINQVTHYNASVTGNIWDTNVCPGAEGNYWSDYAGVDDGSGVGRWSEARHAGDGVGDTLIPHLQVDWYPLMHPWTPVPLIYPVAIFSWSPTEPIVNLPATFNASRSYKINGTLILYRWNFSDGSPIVETIYNVTTHAFTAPGDYNVILTVVDSDSLTNSTSHLIRVLLYKLEVDVYTQQPEPYSGRGLNQPSDAFAPQSQVILYAEVTYNYEPAENKPVAFVVTDPNGEQILYRTGNTSSTGIATVDFRLAANATFGVYNVLATVEVSGKTANDTLTFLMGWLVEIVNVNTVDQYGDPKNIFARAEQIYFSVDVKNIAFTSKNATLTVGIRDQTNQVIGVADISLQVPPGTHEYNLVFNVVIPQWAFTGSSASAHVCALTTWPNSGGVPYCPEISAMFIITP
jgi:nitrous oxidase accessory protein